MSDTVAIILTYRRIVAIHGALTQLANRKLPSITNDLKVARRLDAIKVEYATYEKRRKEIIADHMETDAAGETKAVRALELQQRLDALLDETCDIKEPKSKLTQEDLPKPMKGQIKLPDGSVVEGEMNAAGLGALVADLAPEFFSTPDEE